MSAGLSYLSVCSGIEAATVAWEPLSWTPLAFSEIDRFPSAVLAHHYPTIANLGDMTRFKEWPDAAPDLLVGGTPCQSFSVAGLRKGLADPRGNLALTYLAIADRYRPRWLVWENVPGVLSSDERRAFGAFLGALGQLGYGWAYRSLDAQYFHLAQRRERVFVIGHLGDWRRAAAVLFESESLSGHPAPCREAREDVARAIMSGSSRSGGYRNDVYTKTYVTAELAGTLGAHSSSGRSYGSHPITDSLIAHALRAEGFDASEDGTGRGTPIVHEPYTLAIRGRGESYDLEYRQDGVANAVLTPNGGRGGIGVGAIAFHARQDPDSGPVTHPLDTDGYSIAVGFDAGQITSPTHRRASKDQAGALNGNARECVATQMFVRRLTPRECERLQGFQDDYTLVPYRGKPAKDGPRYKALGNSMAVPVMRWIGARIQSLEQALTERVA